MATNKSNQTHIAEDDVEVPGFLRMSKVVVWALYFFIVLGIISLVLRVILLALSANPNTGFTNLVANISNDYLQPFRGIFETREIGETGYLDVSSLFAIVVYLFILWGVKSLIEYIQNKIDTERAEQLARIRKAEHNKAAAQAKAANNSTRQVKPRAKK